MSPVPALAENTCPKTPSTTQTDSPTVLIVDDYDGVLGVIAAVLLQEGYRVIAFEKAESALQYLQEDHRVDLIISDVIMPGIDGCALARSIRRHRPQTPMLFLTGHSPASLEVHLECGHKCVVPVLQKPFARQELLNSMAGLLSGTRTACLGVRPSDIAAGSDIARKTPQGVLEGGAVPTLATGQFCCHGLKG